MRLIVGAAERGPIVSSAVVVSALAVLVFAVVVGLPVQAVAPVVAATAIAAVAYRSLLAWHTLVAATIIVILLIPIRRYATPGGLPFELEPYRLLVAFIAAGWLASVLVDPRVRLRRSVIDRPLALVGIAALASVIVNGDRIQQLDVSEFVSKRLTFLVSFFLVFYLIVSVIRQRHEIDFLVKWLVSGGCLVAMLALVEAWTGYNVFNDLAGVVPLLELKELPDVGDLQRGARLRVYASAQHPIALGAALVMLVPLAIYLTRRSSRWWLAVLLLLLGSLASVSRTAVLMLLVVGLIFLWLRPVQTRRLWPLVIPALIAVHLALPGAIGTLKASFFPEGGLIAEQRKSPGGAGSGRIADLGPSLNEAAEKPLLGHGYGTRIVEGPKTNARILDNEWLSTLLETGIVGVAAWVWLFGRFIRRLGRAAKEDATERGWLLTGIAASVAAFAVSMLTYDAFSFIQATFLLFFLLGIGAVVLVTDRPRAEPERRRLAA